MRPIWIALFAVTLLSAQPKPAEIATLVHRALGPDISPYAGVKPITADFNGDGKPDLAVAIDFNRKLKNWLRRGDVILDLDSPSLARLRPDNDQHFCFGLLMLDGMAAERKTLFYGCFTGWRLVAAPGAGARGAGLDLDMDSGVHRLYYDGTRYRTRLMAPRR